MQLSRLTLRLGAPYIFFVRRLRNVVTVVFPSNVISTCVSALSEGVVISARLPFVCTCVNIDLTTSRKVLKGTLFGRSFARDGGILTCRFRRWLIALFFMLINRLCI